MDYPILRATKRNTFVLAKEYKIYDAKIPKGAETNGADVPRLFWWLIPPFKPKYLPAIIVHDHYFRTQEYEKANRLFEKILLKIENSLTTKAMILSVKLYTRIKYKR